MIIVRTGWDNNVSELLVKSRRFNALHLSLLSTEIPLKWHKKIKKHINPTRKEQTGEGPVEKIQQNSGRLKMARDGCLVWEDKENQTVKKYK